MTSAVLRSRSGCCCARTCASCGARRLSLGALLAYPVVIALLVGLVAGYASAKPRVAFVDEDHVPPVVSVGGQRFHIQTVIDDVSQNVTLVRMARGRGAAGAGRGQGRRVDHRPARVRGKLTAKTTSPSLVLRTTTGGLAPRVTQQMQSLVYQLNRKLQDAFVSADLAYVKLILHGGQRHLPRPRVPTCSGSTGMQQLRRRAAARRARDGAEAVRGLRAGRADADGRRAEATANPIRLEQPKASGGRGCSRRRCRRTGSRSP